MWNDFKRATIEGVKDGLRWSIYSLLVLSWLGILSCVLLVSDALMR